MWRVSQVNIEKFQSFQAQEHGLLAKDRMEPKPFVRKLCISLLSHAWYLCLFNLSIQSSLPRLSLAEIALVLWLPVRLIFLHCFPFHGLPELQNFLRKQCEQGSLPAWCGKLNCRFNLSTPQAALKMLFSKLWMLKLVWSYSSVETILCLCWGPISSG